MSFSWHLTLNHEYIDIDDGYETLVLSPVSIVSEDSSAILSPAA